MLKSIHQVKRLIVAVIGFSVLAAGIAMIVLPGPAFIVIPLGLFILATEFVWAKRFLQKMRGIIIADTKMEFGIKDGKLFLIDELLTPDSSRFWPKKEYLPGGSQKSFDKQFLRDYLLSIQWDKTPPAPELPEEVIQKTRQKYLEAYVRLVGKSL